MNKICVYTAITGDYDRLKDIKYVDSNIDYICFTNNKKLKSSFWNIVYINEDLDNLLLARKIKILGYKYLEKYDLTIWIDGAIEVLKPISKFLEECCDLKKYDMVGFKHQDRNCIYDEINANIYLSKENIEKALKLEKFLLKEKYPKNNGLIESTVLVRKNNKIVNELMDDWYQMVSNYSRRDQLSFNYVLWKKPIKINFLDMYVFDNKYFKHDRHIGNVEEKKYRIYLGDYSKFDFHKCIDGSYTYDSIKKGISFKLPFDTKRIELLFNEEGNYIESVSLNKKSNILIKNICNIDNKNLFFDTSSIIFEGDFKKNTELVLKANIEKIDYRDNLRKMYLINQEKIGLSDGLKNQIKYSDDLKNNIDKLEKDYKQLINDKNELNNTIANLNNEKNSLNNKTSELSIKVNNLEKELNDIINSKSWKITKPLRTITNKLKKRKSQ